MTRIDPTLYQSSPRERLVSTALRLFSERGYRATGIDTILEEAGVAKATLYHHFKGKTDLILATIEKKSADFTNWMSGELAARAPNDPRGQALAFFDVLQNWFESQDFEGCGFIRAASEFPDPTDPVHRASASFKTATRALLADLLRTSGRVDADGLADTFMLLAEGAIVMAQLGVIDEPARKARDAAERMLTDPRPS